ncbi:hypothetical protein UPYG_G00172960 [Umbra pygmaea]|uniref:MyoD family inhibitor domain-containing protein n=1 Tax=Umbra pygmaea TaxID=75934 RepID=A0ABD0WP42_UMBPY
MIAAMDGNLESVFVNPERSEVRNVIDNLSAHNPVTGLTVNPTEDLSDQMDHKNTPIPLTNASNTEGVNLLPISSALPTTRLGVSHSQPQTDGNSEFDEPTMSEAQTRAVAKHQPQPISPQLSPYQSRLESTSIHRSKAFTAQINQGDGDDLCASILLACLFCQPWDCLLATGEGCDACTWSLCSSLCSKICCCEPDFLDSLQYITDHCGCCGCLDTHCSLCGAPGMECCVVCDVCIETRACLDLGMEISQILFH